MVLILYDTIKNPLFFLLFNTFQDKEQNILLCNFIHTSCDIKRSLFRRLKYIVHVFLHKKFFLNNLNNHFLPIITSES